MSRSLLRTMLALVALAAVFTLAACGSDDEGDGTSAPSDGTSANVTERLFQGSAADNRAKPAEGGRKGGKLTVLSAGDVDYMDPGTTYYVYTMGILNALHRGLYAYLPGDAGEPVPDLAESDPQIAEDGRTVTIKLRRGVMFSKPVDREVTAKDVKYAIERAFTTNVAGPYASIYFGDLVGAPSKPGAYKEISGIQTPDPSTIVFKLEKGTGAALAGALVMPISIPVPREYAERYDKESPSTYDRHQVFTGPYKVETNAEGELTGYVAGKRIHLVRNPEYKNVGDFRPAFLDEIDFRAGNEDTAVATRRILTGESLASGEIEPPASQLKRLLQSNKPELSVVPSGGWRMISIDTSRPPFDDIDVRKAVIAGFDRAAARQQRGGAALGPLAWHFIPPGMKGFEESGGTEVPAEYDWLAKESGDRAKSAAYFKRAGMASGKYEGSERLLLVADNSEPEKSIAQITEQQLKEMGFQTKLRLVTRDTMFTKFCNVPKAEVNVCPSVGWARDFADAQTMIDPTFNGNNIIETGSSNWPELDDESVNAAIEAAKLVTDPNERADAWARVNRKIVALAPSIPYMWDYTAAIASPNVRGVQNGYSTTWDWSFTSLR